MISIAHDTIAIAIGAVCGAITRYHCGRIATEYITSRYQHDISKQSYYLGWHTAFINVSGSFILGCVMGTPVMPTTNHSFILSQVPVIGKTDSTSTISKTDTSSTKPLIHSPTPAQTTTTTARMRSNTATNNVSSLFSLPHRSRLLLGVGFCGSYTTFSTYSVDIVTWVTNGQTSKALSYLAINNIGGITAAAFGMMLVKKMFGQ